MTASTNTWWIAGGHVVDPSQSLDAPADILIEHGRIARVGANLTVPSTAQRIDATGQRILPGLVDLHVHLRQPGREDAETIASGMEAAAAGGFTTICAMPNTAPAIDNPGLVEFVMTEARKAPQPIHVHCLAAVTRERAGQSLTDLANLAEAGAVAFTDDGAPVADAYLMRRALEYARWLGKPIVCHAEDPTLSKGGVMHEGLVSTVLGLRGIPASAETVMIARDIELAVATGGHVHIAHVSAARSIALIRDAKARGIPVTCETAPHYFALTEDAVRGYRTEAKMNPPLRTEADRQAVLDGLADGTIDVIATDHAPHTTWEKSVEFDRAPFGIVGLETAVGLSITHLIEPGRLTWSRLAELMSRTPARVFGLAGGTLQPGSAADLTLIDPRATWTVRPDQFCSKSQNTPFAGCELTGRVTATWCEGRQVYRANGAAHA